MLLSLNGNKVLTCLVFHLIATTKWSLVKQRNFFRKCFDFILLVSQNGNSIKILVYQNYLVE